MGATPQRISTSAEPLLVRGVVIEYAQGNTGLLYVADRESNATTTNRHTLDSSNQFMAIEPDEWGALKGLINLNEIWIHGDTTGDKFVISYMDMNECFE